MLCIFFSMPLWIKNSSTDVSVTCQWLWIVVRRSSRKKSLISRRVRDWDSYRSQCIQHFLIGDLKSWSRCHLLHIFFKVIMLSAKLHTSYCLVLPLPLRKKAEGCIDKVLWHQPIPSLDTNSAYLYAITVLPF